VKLTQVNDQVWMVMGTNVNWAIVTEGDGVTLVDAGYPNDANDVIAALEALGHRPEDIAAVLLTHAHLDHMGGIRMLADKYGTKVMTCEEEARHARREYLEQIRALQMFAQCYRLAGIRWVAATLRAVLPHAKMALRDVVAVPAGVALDLPGGLVPIATPGHTPGHTSFLMPSTGTLLSGDTLVTGHPISKVGRGPQKLPGVFNFDESGVSAAIKSLREIPADTLVPGHGDLMRTPIAQIVDDALNRTP
jgi:glyoxylase-like metal-dependent hydrolase (beta-lactamase superfamily II)